MNKKEQKQVGFFSAAAVMRLAISLCGWRDEGPSQTNPPE